MAKRQFRIDTPLAQTIKTKTGKVSLEFKTNFGPRWIKKYSAAQNFIDNEVLRRSEPYVPLLTGTLRNTGILGTDIGSGLVQWLAPYAHYQYYSKRDPGSATGPLRGPFWFERMKATWKKTIITGARRLVGQGSEL